MKDVLVVGAGSYQLPKALLPAWLLPGVHQARMTGFEPVRGSNKNGLRFKLMMAALALQGTVMYEMRMHDDHLDMIHHPWIYKSPRGKRSRHYKAKAQPNCGPRSNNPW